MLKQRRGISTGSKSLLLSFSHSPSWPSRTRGLVSVVPHSRCTVGRQPGTVPVQTVPVQILQYYKQPPRSSAGSDEGLSFHTTQCITACLCCNTQGITARTHRAQRANQPGGDAMSPLQHNQCSTNIKRVQGEPTELSCLQYKPLNPADQLPGLRHETQHVECTAASSRARFQRWAGATNRGGCHLKAAAAGSRLRHCDFGCTATGANPAWQRQPVVCTVCVFGCVTDPPRARSAAPGVDK